MTTTPTPEQTAALRESVVRHVWWAVRDARQLAARTADLGEQVRRWLATLGETFPDEPALRAWCREHLPDDLAELFPALAPPAAAHPLPGPEPTNARAHAPAPGADERALVRLAALVERHGGAVALRTLGRNNRLRPAAVRALVRRDPARRLVIRRRPTAGRPSVVLTWRG